jgi:UDPglucose--hexose-1-phosphate uridylyltransferase
MLLMELRKDPITRSWVVTGDDAPVAPAGDAPCRYCPGPNDSLQVVSSMPPVGGEPLPWSARAVVHPTPLYRVEGEPMRRADGIYDKMRPVGAHEVLVENPHHARQLWNAGTEEVRQFLELVARRILDLKLDRRFKYVTVFKDYGEGAGQEFEHATSQLVATTFVPRRVLYELRAGREYFAQKERCVFCDILAQEQRQAIRLVESRGDYVALCPYAPRVPFETWILPATHDAAFEKTSLARPEGLFDLAGLLRNTLRRVLTVATAFHLVLHTAPNTLHKSATLGYWKTIDEDYHWHLEIMPVVPGRMRSYTAKETYFSPVSSETAAAKLREAKLG